MLEIKIKLLNIIDKYKLYLLIKKLNKKSNINFISLRKLYS